MKVLGIWDLDIADDHGQNPDSQIRFLCESDKKLIGGKIFIFLLPGLLSVCLPVGSYMWLQSKNEALSTSAQFNIEGITYIPDIDELHLRLRLIDVADAADGEFPQLIMQWHTEAIKI